MIESSRRFIPRSMPLLTLDRVSIAYGHLPLLDEASLQVEPGERVCVIGRNGTGKSTLAEHRRRRACRPTPGRVWTQPDLRIGRLAQDAPFFDERPVFDVVADGLGDLAGAGHRLPPRGRGGGRRGDARPARAAGGAAARARTARRLAARAAGRGRARSPGAAGRRQRRHAVGRLAAPRAAGARARRPAGPAAARRADEPSRHRGDDVARGVPHRPTRAPWCSSRTTASSCRTSRRASSSSIAAACRRGRATTPPSCAARRNGWPPRRCGTRSSTRSSPRKRSGCARASRRGAPATRGACAR